MDERERLAGLTARLRRHARALAGDPASADDLVRDTLERAFAEPPALRSDADLRAWMLGLMHHVYVRRLRTTAAAAEPLQAGGTDMAPSAQGAPLLLSDFQRAMDLLPAEQRAVFLLVTLEDMSYDDVARTLEIPVGTVMSRLSRARERLRAMLLGQARLKAEK